MFNNNFLNTSLSRFMRGLAHAVGAPPPRPNPGRASKKRGDKSSPLPTAIKLEKKSLPRGTSSTLRKVMRAAGAT